jgi:inosine-uridine nucleoside N-ribohydrolase
MIRTLMSLALVSALATAGEPVRVIFDTDMGNDIDDAVALAILHALESRGEARLLAVTLTKDNPMSAPYVDAVNVFYGRGHIPVGVVRNGKTPENVRMLSVPLERKAADGSPLYPRRIRDGSEAPEAVALLRRVLGEQPDNSVVLVQVGFCTNYARLLDSAGGRELVARKVALLSVMGGAFPAGSPEYNIKIDIPASKKLFSQWPGPIVVSGFEVGNSMLFPASSVENDFNWVRDHPVVDAYRAYKKMPYDRPTWDPTAALYAVRPNRGYFSLSPNGTITVDDQGRTQFAETPGGKHRYLAVNEAQRARTLEAMIALATEPLAGQPAPQYEILRTSGPITIDARLDEASWRKAPTAGAFHFNWWTGGEQEQTEARLLWDDENLYVAWYCHDKHISASVTQRHGPVSNDDCVEIFLSPNPEKVRNYYTFEINAIGSMLNRARTDWWTGPPTWEPEGVRYRTSFHSATPKREAPDDNHWIVELAIPFRNFARDAAHVPPKPGDTWRLNLYRTGGVTNKQSSSWSPIRPPSRTFHTPESFGTVRFVDRR